MLLGIFVVRADVNELTLTARTFIILLLSLAADYLFPVYPVLNFS